jgi:hypothetical protein
MLRLVQAPLPVGAGGSGWIGAHSDAVSRQDRPRARQTVVPAGGPGSGTRRRESIRNPRSRSPPGTSGRYNGDSTVPPGRVGQDSQDTSIAKLGGRAGKAGAVVTVT